MEVTLARKSKGWETAFIPNQVRRIKIIIKFQNKISLMGLNEKDCQEDFERIGKVYRIAIAKTSPITPPNLLGTLRRIV